MCPSEYFAHRPGRGQRDAQCAEEPGIEQPDGKKLAGKITLSMGQERDDGFRRLPGVLNRNRRMMIKEGRSRSDHDECRHKTRQK